MPSGTYVIVRPLCWSSGAGSCSMDITVVPSSDPESISEGLCGNANGNPWDDFMLPNSDTMDNNSDEPVVLAGSYM